ncbi:hypothetical protein D3C72_2352490 [compost metagenome]
MLLTLFSGACYLAVAEVLAVAAGAVEVVAVAASEALAVEVLVVAEAVAVGNLIDAWKY